MLFLEEHLRRDEAERDDRDREFLLRVMMVVNPERAKIVSDGWPPSSDPVAALEAVEIAEHRVASRAEQVRSEGTEAGRDEIVVEMMRKIKENQRERRRG